MASPAGRFLPFAGAEDEPAPDPAADLADADFAAAASILELAAVLTYQAALDARSRDESLFDADVADRLLRFQGQHTDVVTALADLLDKDAATPVASPTYTKAWSVPLASPADANEVYSALATVEQTLAATHLDAIGSLIDPITAKIVGQVLSVEAEKAALLASMAGQSLDTLATAEVSTDASVLTEAAKEAKELAEAATTTTTAATGN
jgi:hypothetical protein